MWGQTKKTIPKVPNISPSKFLKNLIQTNFIIVHISNEEILDIINTENKSTGLSSIPLNLIPDLIIIPLAYIIIFSLSTGENIDKTNYIIFHPYNKPLNVHNYIPKYR